jgi:hypothetical protein
MDFDTYVREHWFNIDGWNEQGAFTALKLIHDYQREHSIFGHVGEIGVHEGQFFFALALLAKSFNVGEHSFAIDVFDKQERNIDKSGCASAGRFTETAREILKDDPQLKFLHLIQNDSLSVTSEYIGSIIFNRCRLHAGLRLLSIDGGHTKTHALNDLKLAEQSMRWGGVAILDDFLNPKWPGVTEAAHIYCADPYSRLVPFAYGNKKLYLTTFDYAKRYFELFRDTEQGVKDRKEVEIWNRPLVWVYFE